MQPILRLIVPIYVCALACGAGPAKRSVNPEASLKVTSSRLQFSEALCVPFSERVYLMKRSE
jgi:hypothetical protein